MFDTTKLTIGELLEQIDGGAIQLPESQRDYVWSEDAVVSLLASTAKGYPVGALLMLERGGEVDFQPRAIEGTQHGAVTPDVLLLDGQQRMTSLYQALWCNRPVQVKDNKGQRVERRFFIDLQKAVADGAAFEDAIEIVAKDGRRYKAFGREIAFDVSSPERQFARHMFPLNRIFECDDWFYDWHDYWRAQGQDVFDLDKRFKRTVIRQIQAYEMPIIKLTKHNGREAVCTIFEKVNVGGVKLDAFELVTATYAGSSFDLRREWSGTKRQSGRLARLQAVTPKDQGIYANLSSLDFLQACTILHTHELRANAAASGKSRLDLPPVSCKRETLLALPVQSYMRHADAAEKGFIEAAAFLAEHKILFARDLPYPTQVVALAALFALLKGRTLSMDMRERIGTWHWAGIFGEYYGSATETKIARDVSDFEAWIDGGPEPRTWSDCLFQVSRLRRLRTRMSAAYKGFHALLMRHGCRDFISGKPVELMAVWNNPLDIHHIFPRDWCEKQGIAPARSDSAINKTALSAETNRAIGGSAPSLYLARIEQRSGIQGNTLDAILRSHLIDPAHLRADDFEGFWSARETALAQLAAEAMGKPVIASTPGGNMEDDVLVDEAA